MIGEDLGGGVTGLQWVADGYLLTFAGLMLVAGRLADRVGAQQAMTAGFAVFTLASLACGLAPSLEALTGARLAQGVGAALMTPAGLSLIRETYSDPYLRARAVAVWALGGSIGSALGPVLGGSLSLVSWRLIFLVNLPLGVAALLLSRRVPASARRRAPIDIVGQVTVVVAMVSGVFALIEAGVAGIGTRAVLVAAGIAIAAMVVFLIVEVSVAEPMIPLGMFRSPAVVVVVAGGFAFTVSYYGVIFVVSLFLQLERGLTALGAGLTFLPMAIVASVVPFLGTRVAVRHGYWMPVSLGMALSGAAALGIRSAVGSESVMAVTLWFVPLAIGGALAMPCLTTALLENVSAHLAGTASGVLNTARQFGGAVGVAVFGSLTARPESMVAGTQMSLLIAAIPLILIAAAAIVLRPGRPSFA